MKTGWILVLLLLLQGCASQNTLRSTPWVLLGEGSAALVVSVVASVASQQAADACPRDESGNRLCTSEAMRQDLAQQETRWGQVALGTGALGALSVGTAAVWLPVDLALRHSRRRRGIVPFPIAQPSSGTWGLGIAGSF